MAETGSMDMMGSLTSFAVLILMFVVFYFILIRPQRKKEKELKEQMSKLNVGDRVTTIGGLVGFVANIKDDQVTISTSAANTLVTFTKSAIRQSLSVTSSILTEQSRRARSLLRPVSLERRRQRKRKKSNSFIFRLFNQARNITGPFN